MNELIQANGEPLNLNTKGSDESHSEWTQKFNLHLISLEVAKLKPTQSEISLQKSLNYVLEDTEDPQKYFTDEGQLVGFPIITYGGEYVLDGHHRWSELYLVNPKSKILAYDFQKIPDIPEGVPPLSILAKMQATIGVVFGTLPIASASGDINLYGKDVKKAYELILNKYFNK